MSTSPESLPDLRVVAARLGGLAWISDQLFLLQGRWASDVELDRAVEHLATHSRHHGWHGQLLTDALPDSPALQAASLVTAPTGWSAAFSLADQLGTDGPDVAKLALLYRGLVPRYAGLVEALTRRLAGPSSPALIRVLGFVATDTSSDVLGGIALLSEVLVDDQTIQRAADVTRALDSVMTK